MAPPAGAFRKETTDEDRRVQIRRPPGPRPRPHLRRPGRLRALAIASAERVEGIDIPTLREQGVPVTLVNWRGVFAPPGLSDEQRDRLGATVDAMVKTTVWTEARITTGRCPYSTGTE